MAMTRTRDESVLALSGGSTSVAVDDATDSRRW